MIQLHYHPGNASFAPHVLLAEIGAPYQLLYVDRAQGAHKTPQFLKLNPNGLIPVLVDEDLVLYESAAICLHLVDSWSAAGLAPEPGTPQRAHFYKWLAWLSNTLQPQLMLYFYPERWVDEGNADGAAQLRQHAVLRISDGLRQIDDQLAGHGGPWLLGADYSAVDAYALMLCRWTRAFKQAEPARRYAHIGPWLQRMLERPAVQRVIAKEGLTAPLV